MTANGLYDEQIVEHSKKPRNHRRLETANRMAEGHNPLCGDHQIVYIDVQGNRINEITFLAVGDDAVKNCAISKASASMMTKFLKDKTITEAESIFQHFHQMLTGSGNEDSSEELGHLRIFSGVRNYPMRVKCATLPWHTMIAALRGNDTATSE
jgi:nitrogen fixation protein NifU and related proteins